MEKNCTVIISNTFDERCIYTYGMFAEDEAEKFVQKYHDDVIKENEECGSDSCYSDAIKITEVENGMFSIEYYDGTFTDCFVSSILNPTTGKEIRVKEI